MADMTPEQRAKMMDKIRKCLALGQSPEPHEAAAAMRQAQKLMATLGVTPEDLGLLSIESATVKTREGFGNCRYVQLLGHMICKAYGCDYVMERNPGSANRMNVRYVGPRGRPQLAEWTHRVLQRAMDGAWERHLARFPHHKGDGGKRESFRIGWIIKVTDQVEKMAPTAEEADAMAKWKAKEYGGRLTEAEMRKGGIDRAVAARGHAAAEGFTLHRPMGAEKLKLGHDR